MFVCGLSPAGAVLHVVSSPGVGPRKMSLQSEGALHRSADWWVRTECSVCPPTHTHTHISGVLNHLPSCCGDSNVLQRTVPPLSPLSCAVCGPPRRFHALTSAAATHDITDILQTESPLLNQLQAVRFNVFRDDSCVCVDRSRTKTLTQTHEMLLEVCRNLRRVFIWMILKSC